MTFKVLVEKIALNKHKWFCSMVHQFPVDYLKPKFDSFVNVWLYKKGKRRENGREKGWDRRWGGGERERERGLFF